MRRRYDRISPIRRDRCEEKHGARSRCEIRHPRRFDAPSRSRSRSESQRAHAGNGSVRLHRRSPAWSYGAVFKGPDVWINRGHGRGGTSRASARHIRGRTSRGWRRYRELTTVRDVAGRAAAVEMAAHNASAADSETRPARDGLPDDIRVVGQEAGRCGRARGPLGHTHVNLIAIA